MYFVPPGFDPGPTALAVAAVLLLVMLLRPLFSMRTYSDAPGAPAALTQLAVVHLGFVLAEAVLAVVVLYTLHAATPAALGLAPVSVGPEHLWQPEGVGHWFGPASAVALCGFALLAALVWWDRRSARAEPVPPIERMVPRTAGGWLLFSFVPVLDAVSGVIVFALVLYPTVAVLVSPWAAVLAAGWMWGWRSWRCPMSNGVGASTTFGFLSVLLYALGFPGFLLPVLLIMVGMGGHRAILHFRVYEALADRAEEEAPLEVLEVTAEDPGRR
ncbi:hypothetical protein [Nocardiopsis sp. CC223A]|uniref:hypothetical protein n=1 Tax=Nocardiopsis sp. CC223A TaxID=3044051 RepID=UPI00278C64E5|nr:hypothetical protein [Nocardiopsis sp. CC223A]